MVAAKKSTAAKAEPRKRLARDYDRAFARELARAYREQHPRPDPPQGMSDSAGQRGRDIGEALEYFVQHGTWERTRTPRAAKATAATAPKRLAREFDRAFARELARVYREQHPRPDRAVRRSDIGEALDWFAQHGTWEKSPRDLAPWNALAARVYYQRARGEAKRRAEWAADDEERLAIAKAVSAAKARGKKLTAVEVKTAARKAHEARAKEKVSVDDLIADTAESLTLGIKTVRVAIYRRKATK